MESEILGLVAILLLGGMVFYYFVCWTVRRGLQDCARAYYDAQFREERIAALSAQLADLEPCLKTARLYQQRAQLYYFSGMMDAAVNDARTYTAVSSDDAEGWAELAEYALANGDPAAAGNAAAKALCGSDRDDYHALALRAALWLNDCAAAGDELQKWRVLDDARVANPPQPHRWSFFAQMPKAKIVSDPAIAYYEAVLAARRGDSDVSERVSSLQNSESDFYAAMTATRMIAVRTAGPLAFPEISTAGNDMTEAFTAAAQAGAYAVVLDAGCGAAELTAALQQAAAWMDDRLMPHLLFVRCADALQYDEVRAFLENRNRCGCNTAENPGC